MSSSRDWVGENERGPRRSVGDALEKGSSKDLFRDETSDGELRASEGDPSVGGVVGPLEESSECASSRYPGGESGTYGRP